MKDHIKFSLRVLTELYEWQFAGTQSCFKEEKGNFKDQFLNPHISSLKMESGSSSEKLVSTNNTT
jgi:hypothetical protein